MPNLPSALDPFELNVNNTTHTVQDAWIGESLLYVLRERLGLPGAKAACEQGECGSCSVLVDKQLVCSCLVMAGAAVGAQIETVESLTANDGTLDAVQQAFNQAGAVQCGFCTPGLIMSVKDLLDHNPTPSELEVQEAISGNLCRCTGYGRILAAVETAVQLRSPGDHA